MSSQAKQVGSGIFWKILENGGSQGVLFLVSLVLARLLSPKEYGIIAIISIFINIANVLIQNGFGIALIQKEKVDENDFSSVFIINLSVSAILYGVLFVTAPFISEFYNNDILTVPLRLMSVIVFPGAVISIQNAYISRKMQFRSLFIGTTIAAIFSGSVSIYMAYTGFSVYALVWQQILYYFILMFSLFILTDLKLKPVFVYSKIKILFSFGWKILIASLIDNIFNNIYGLAFGKAYSEDVLGNYVRGEQFPKLIVTNLGSAMQAVILPLMSSRQNNKDLLKDTLRYSVILSSYITFPLMFGLISVADKVVAVLLGDKWLESVIFLQLLCLGYAVWPLHIANLQAINALGRSDKFLKLEVIKKSIGVLALIIGIMLGSIEVVVLKVLADFVSVFINSYPNKKLLGYGSIEQIKDVSKSLYASIIMCIIVGFIGKCLKSDMFSLLLSVISGAIIYIILSILMRNESFMFLKAYFLENRRKDG